jgi:hypothetical protein
MSSKLATDPFASNVSISPHPDSLLKRMFLPLDMTFNRSTLFVNRCASAIARARISAFDEDDDGRVARRRAERVAWMSRLFKTEGDGPTLWFDVSLTPSLAPVTEAVFEMAFLEVLFEDSLCSRLGVFKSIQKVQVKPFAITRT